jgi:GNAT superfamily N-acetyltransferase
MTDDNTVDVAVFVAGAVKAALDQLADVLMDCVDGGAAVGFARPLVREDAVAFYEKVGQAVARDEAVLVAARMKGRIVGSVQLDLVAARAEPQRAEVTKLLVHRDARHHGIGTYLLQCAEDEARQRGKTQLFLKTVAGSDADRLCRANGWICAGIIPGQAAMPDGTFADAAFFGKSI